MRFSRLLLPAAFALASVLAPRIAVSQGSYLFVWTGGAGPGATDFMATIDANPASSTYGRVLASIRLARLECRITQNMRCRSMDIYLRMISQPVTRGSL